MASLPLTQEELIEKIHYLCLQSGYQISSPIFWNKREDSHTTPKDLISLDIKPKVDRHSEPVTNCHQVEREC